MGMPCVKGNHDEYCSAEVGLEGFNPAAAGKPWNGRANSSAKRIARGCAT